MRLRQWLHRDQRSVWLPLSVCGIRLCSNVVYVMYMYSDALTLGDVPLLVHNVQFRLNSVSKRRPQGQLTHHKAVATDTM